MSNVQVGQRLVNARITLFGWELTVERVAENVKLVRSWCHNHAVVWF